MLVHCLYNSIIHFIYTCFSYSIYLCFGYSLHLCNKTQSDDTSLNFLVYGVHRTFTKMSLQLLFFLTACNNERVGGVKIHTFYKF